MDCHKARDSALQLLKYEYSPPRPPATATPNPHNSRKLILLNPHQFPRKDNNVPPTTNLSPNLLHYLHLQPQPQPQPQPHHLQQQSNPTIHLSPHRLHIHILILIHLTNQIPPPRPPIHAPPIATRAAQRASRRHGKPARYDGRAGRVCAWGWRVVGRGVYG